MQDKTLGNTNMDDLKNNVSDVKVHGDPGRWVCVAKASSEKEGWMKSTKVFELGGVHSCLVQVSTQQRNPDGSWSIAEALTYVPNVRLANFGVK